MAASRRRHPPGRGRSEAARCVLSLAACVACGCAPASPLLLGGGTTPEARVDVALGGAVRVPIEGLAPPSTAGGGDEFASLAGPGGAVPLASVRVGALPDLDVGLAIGGTTARLSVAYETRVTPSLHLILGAQPFGGAAFDPARQGSEGGEGFRVGGLGVAALGVEIGSVFEGWAGVRAGGEHVEGALGPSSARRAGHAGGARVGGVVGLAAGFRRVHALVELGVDHEWWEGALDGAPWASSGVAITPAFGLRVRF